MPSQAYKDLLDSAWDLHVAKNAGYAGAENPDPWANFRMSEEFGVSALEGCLVRMSDKYIRITNLMKDASNEQVGESIRDTLRDLSAYALIAVCLLDERANEREERSYTVEKIKQDILHPALPPLTAEERHGMRQARGSCVECKFFTGHSLACSRWHA